MNVYMPYHLLHEPDGEVYFSAAYVKYIPDSAYCCLYEQYPAMDTRILLCRKANDPDEAKHKAIYTLVNRTANSADVPVGRYLPIAEVRSEGDAIERVEANIAGDVTLRLIIRQNTPEPPPTPEWQEI